MLKNMTLMYRSENIFLLMLDFLPVGSYWCHTVESGTIYVSGQILTNGVYDPWLSAWYINLCDSPANPKELFNLRHSQCRNAIERIFGCVKKCFKILREANEFPIEIQGRLTSAICIVHNFIQIHDPEDLSDSDEEDYYLVAPSIPSTTGNGTISLQERNEAAKRRNDIANAMWIQYQRYLSSRRR
jgi:hypothetical protein